MKDRISEELLSAYFDGELSPKERLQVESWLNSSPEARQQVADYRRLSRMFEGLTRTEVPQEFPTEVLQLAERRMLLPDSSPSLRRVTTIRLRWVAIPTAAAAALLLAFNLWNRDAGPGRGAVAVLDRAPQGKQELPARAPSAGSSSPASEPRSEDNVRPKERPAGEALTASADAKNSTSKDSAAEAGPLADHEQSIAEKSGDVAADAMPVVADAETDPRAIALVADAVAVSQQPEVGDKSLSAVTVYVDGTDGLALVQKFLEDNEITAESGVENEPVADETAKKAGKTVAAPAADNQALCVVVTEPEQLVRAFTTMFRERHPAFRIATEDPIVLTALDDESQALLAQAQTEVRKNLDRLTAEAAKDGVAPGQPGTAPGAAARGDGQNADVARKAESKSSRGAGLAKRGAAARSKAQLMDRHGAEKIVSAAVKPPAANPADAEAAKDADEGEPRQAVSRQVIVAVPEAYRSRARSGGRRESDHGRDNRAQAQPTIDDNAASAKADVEETDARPAPTVVRMLIVVEQESPPAATAAPEEK